MSKLSLQEIENRLKALPGWKLDGEVICKKFTLPSFPHAIRFVNQVADLAEQADHHPDIHIDYRRVTLTLSTHSEGGITHKDFLLAEKIEKDCAAV